MISRQDLERLANLKSDHGILTAYIPLDPRLRFVRQQPASQFKRGLKEAKRRIEDGRWREALERESSHVLDFLSNWDPGGRGLVIFSCRPESIWEVLPLEFLVPNLVDIDTTTKTGVLAQSIEEMPRFIVAVVQRDRSRIYVVEHGMAGQQAQVASEVPGQHKQGGRSQMRFQRHIDFHVTEHLKKVADELQKLAKLSPFELVLGGTDEIVNETLTMLAEPVAQRVIGKFPVDYKHDTEQEIFERAETVWKNRERVAETNLLDQVVEQAKSGRKGVLGVELTLSALMEEKVRTLLIANGFGIDGSVCTRCDYVAERNFETCPLCGGNGEKKDITDRVVEKAILTGAAAEVVCSEEARDRLLAEGGVGGLLRY